MSSLQIETYTLRRILIIALAVGFGLFQLYTAVFGSFTMMVQRGVHLAFGAPLVFLVFPTLRRKSLVLDLSLAGFCAALFIFVAVNNDYIVERLLYVDPLPPLYIAAGLAGILFVLEIARRTVGNAFTGLASLFFIYIFLGQFIPGLAGHRGFSLKTAVEHLFYTTEGIFGIPVGVSSTYVFIFVMFGVFLEVTGGGKFFLDIVTSLVGHKIGGPAKVALFASATMGTISGSAIANVATTGTFTIPLMKKIGFDKEYAGGVEAMASTGGQLMPPIMGVAAFIMAQFSGYPYFRIAGAAVIPAILYYNSALWQIHFYSVRSAIPCLRKDELPDSKKVLREGWFYIIPLAVIIYFLMNGYTATTAGVWGLLSTVLANLLLGDRKNLSIERILLAMEKTARAMLIVIGAVSAAGIIIGSLSLTGLGVSIGSAIMSLAKNSQFLALFFTALMATILGLGMPTSGAYIICAAVLVPSLINIGIFDLSAHFFALFYASLSVITPPVALASYTAASIACASPWKTGLKGFKLALAAYIIPFFFVYNPALLGEGTILQIALASVTGFIGTYALAGAVEGWVFDHLSPLIRLILGAGAVMLIFPGIYTDITGFALICVIFLFNSGLGKKLGRRRIKTVSVDINTLVDGECDE